LGGLLNIRLVVDIKYNYLSDFMRGYNIGSVKSKMKTMVRKEKYHKTDYL